MVKGDNFSIKITGINKLMRELDLLVDGIELELDELLRDFTKEYYTEVIESAPYDTGLYQSKWYWNQTGLGRFIIWNDYSQVYNTNHYSYYLVYGSDNYLMAAASGKYKYVDPFLGILHDISQINTIMNSRVDNLIRVFSVNKAMRRA